MKSWCVLYISECLGVFDGDGTGWPTEAVLATCTSHEAAIAAYRLLRGRCRHALAGG